MSYPGQTPSDIPTPTTPVPTSFDLSTVPSFFQNPTSSPSGFNVESPPVPSDLATAITLHSDGGLGGFSISVPSHRSDLDAISVSSGSDEDENSSGGCPKYVFHVFDS